MAHALSPPRSPPGSSAAAPAGDPALLFLLYLVPVGVALAVVDWRTRFLPTRLIAPSYVVVGAAGAGRLRCSARRLAAHW